MADVRGITTMASNGDLALALGEAEDSMA